MRESLPDSCHILPQWIETTVTFNNLIFSLLSCVVVLSFSDSFLPSNKAVGTITSNQSLSLPPSILFSSRVCPSTIAWSLSQHSTPYYKEINNNKLRERERDKVSGSISYSRGETRLPHPSFNKSKRQEWNTTSRLIGTHKLQSERGEENNKATAAYNIGSRLIGCNNPFSPAAAAAGAGRNIFLANKNWALFYLS